MSKKQFPVYMTIFGLKIGEIFKGQIVVLCLVIGFFIVEGFITGLAWGIIAVTLLFCAVSTLIIEKKLYKRREKPGTIKCIMIYYMLMTIGAFSTSLLIWRKHYNFNILLLIAVQIASALAVVPLAVKRARKYGFKFRYSEKSLAIAYAIPVFVPIMMIPYIITPREKQGQLLMLGTCFFMVILGLVFLNGFVYYLVSIKEEKKKLEKEKL